MYVDTSIVTQRNVSRHQPSCLSTDNRIPQILTNLLNVTDKFYIAAGFQWNRICLNSDIGIASYWWLNKTLAQTTHHNGLLQDWQVQVLSASSWPWPVSLLAVVAPRHHHPGLHPLQADPGRPHDSWDHRPHHRLHREQPRLQVAHLHDKPGKLGRNMSNRVEMLCFQGILLLTLHYVLYASLVTANYLLPRGFTYTGSIPFLYK